MMNVSIIRISVYSSYWTKAEAVTLHTFTWRYLLSRQMLGQYLTLGQNHLHILSYSPYITILSFYTIQYVTALLNKLQISNNYNKHFLIHTTMKENIHNIDFVIFTDRLMLWLPQKTTWLTWGDNHSMTCYYKHSKNLKFYTSKRIIYYNRTKYLLLFSHITIQNTKPNTCSSIMNISQVTLYHTSLLSAFHAISMLEWWKYIMVFWFVNMSEKLAVSTLQQQK
jgi:hypothetical protein